MMQCYTSRHINLKGTKSHATANLNSFATLMTWLMGIYSVFSWFAMPGHDNHQQQELTSIHLVRMPEGVGTLLMAV